VTLLASFSINPLHTHQIARLVDFSYFPVLEEFLHKLVLSVANVFLPLNLSNFETERERTKKHSVMSIDKANIYRIHFAVFCGISFRSQVMNVWKMRGSNTFATDYRRFPPSWYTGTAWLTKLVSWLQYSHVQNVLVCTFSNLTTLFVNQDYTCSTSYFDKDLIVYHFLFDRCLVQVIRFYSVH